MSSLLSEILHATEETERFQMDKSIKEITQKVTSLKSEVKVLVDDTYVNFNVDGVNHDHLIVQSKSVLEELNKLHDTVEKKTKRDMKDSTGELKRLSSSLQETIVTLSFVNQILAIHEEVQKAEEAQANGEYLLVAEHLSQAEKMFREPSDCKEFLIYRALEEAEIYQKVQFLCAMTDIWSSCLTWQEDDKQICFKVDVGRTKEIKCMMQAFSMFDNFAFYMSQLSKKMLKSVLTELIVKDSCVDSVVVNKVAMLKMERNPGHQKPAYTKVFSNVWTVFNFLKTYLNVDIAEGETFINRFGQLISQEFCDVLVKECLSETIPSHGTDLEAFGTVAVEIEELQASLVKVGFLNESNQSIVSYAKNVDVLCANKECQMILTKARSIMKKDLHDMVEVGHMEPSDRLVMANDDKTYTNVMKPDIELHDNTFQFPRCQISKSCKQLLDLAHKVLAEASKSSELCAVRLFYTVRNVFELYGAVVPTFHKKLLETIPQQAALFHNNSMFLGHELLTLAHTYQDSLPQVLRGTTFIDQVQRLRELGANMFLKQLQQQRKQILDILRDSDLASLGERPKLPPKTENSIRQCLRQLELLQSVWQNVLSSSTYNKAIGCLLNGFADELITRVVTVEDIPANTAIMLVTLFRIVINRAPNIFKEPKEVHRHVKRWSRLEELVIVLGAKLQEIDDRWAVGKGPLANEFTAEQVKKLIRALFQNTERRSAILARIR